MSYVLLYTEGGRETSSEPMFSLEQINQHIRDLYDTESAEEPIVVLAVREDQDAPLTWTRPEAPEGVTRVLGEATGQTWTAVKNRIGLRPLWSNGEYSLAWPELLNHEGTLTEVVETELEGAARRLRERGIERITTSQYKDIQVVLAHVLGGGTL